MEKIHPLKAWRLARGLTPHEVGNRLRCSVQTVYRYEAGTRTPERSVLDRIIIMTEGAVTANDWIGEQASRVLSGQPASAVGAASQDAQG